MYAAQHLPRDTVKERYQDIDDKNEELRGHMNAHKLKGQEFLDRFEMSWVYHDNALEGLVYTPQELQAALHPGTVPAEASMMPIILEIRNHRAAVDFIRDEARTRGKKTAAITLATIRHLHDLLSGNTPEALAARAATERRERSEREKEKEKERSGFRRDMPLHRTYFHEIAQPSKIPALLDKLVEQTATSEWREQHPIKQAASIQYQFVQIFPFPENSGKVGRMLTNMLLLQNGYLPVIVHAIDRQRYYESFRQPQTVFRNLMMDAMENSLDNAVKFFRDLNRRYKAIN